MRGLPPIGCSFRVRRWDAVVLGSALPGLIAAIRLGMRDHRVLILEEDAAAVAYPGMREPFMMAGSGSDGVLGSCLKALEIPLIDRRRIRAAFPAYQVALPRRGWTWATRTGQPKNSRRGISRLRKRLATWSLRSERAPKRNSAPFSMPTSSPAANAYPACHEEFRRCRKIPKRTQIDAAESRIPSETL